MPGTFIDIQIDGSIKNDGEVAEKLAEVCPVDIFAADNGSVNVVEDNLDECVLCDLCVEAAPEGTVKVVKLY